MLIEKLPLFSSRRELLFAFAGGVLLFLLHLGWIYRGYLDFIDRPFYYTWAKVLHEYPKKNPHVPFQILKIQTDGGKLFYTKSYKPYSLEGKRIRLQLFPKKLSFYDYLQAGFLPSRIKEIQASPPGLRSFLSQQVAAQHRDPKIARFYNAIFFATALDPDLRRAIAALGVSHLVALSGFHLGMLWGILFLLLSPLYRFIQNRYFPWHYDLLDLGSITLGLLAGYLLLVGAPPSLLRSYAMLLLGWAALLLGIELLSFSFLAVSTALLLLLFPPLIFSLGFWLSIAGVFYIYLLLHYWKKRSAWLFAGGVMPIGIYLLMLPLTHTLFPIVSPWQGLSPLLSLLFIPFYPLSILLHLLGEGALLDPLLQALFSLPGPFQLQRLPLAFLAIYLLLSLFAVRYGWAFALLGGMSVTAAAWIYF